MHTNIHTCIHIHICTYIHRYIHEYVHSSIHTYKIHTYVRTYIHAYIPRCTRTHIHMYKAEPSVMQGAMFIEQSMINPGLLASLPHDPPVNHSSILEPKHTREHAGLRQIRCELYGPNEDYTGAVGYPPCYKTRTHLAICAARVHSWQLAIEN